MARVKTVSSSAALAKTRPALTPEAEENECISLAFNLVKQRLIDGTASSQETTHFLKLATAKSRYELELTRAQTEMAIAKKETLQSQKRSDEMYANAIKAFRTYSGYGSDEDYDEYDDY